MYLSRLISELLSLRSPEAAYQWQLNFNPPDNMMLERTMVNRYLRAELSRLPVDTRDARMCLSDMTPEDDYVRHLKAYVIPVLTRYGLPSWTIPTFSPSTAPSPAM